MRSTSLSWLALSVSVLCVGCGPREAAKPAGGNASDQPNFASRLDAAKAIGNTATRDEALSQLAVDAAAGGDGETTKKAIEAIGNSSKKDETASRSALKLGKVGKGDDANTIARLIGNSAVRDQTLAKIAKGEFGE